MSLDFDAIGDRLERLCAHPLALPLFTVVFVGGMATAGVDATNIAVSYFTVALLLLGMGRARRDRKAVQAKLDEVVKAIPEARSELSRLEEEPEEAIDAKRD